MTNPPIDPVPRNGPTSWERILVIVPPIFPGLMAAVFPPAAPLLIAAIVWTVLASLGLALRRVILHGDRSGFTNRREPPTDHTKVDLCTRTGLYQWLKDADDQLLQNDDHPD